MPTKTNSTQKPNQPISQHDADPRGHNTNTAKKTKKKNERTTTIMIKDTHFDPKKRLESQTTMPRKLVHKTGQREYWI